MDVSLEFCKDVRSWQKKKKECVEESRLPRGGGVAAPSAPARPVFPAGPLRPGGLVLPTGAACGGRTPRGGSRRSSCSDSAVAPLLHSIFRLPCGTDLTRSASGRHGTPRAFWGSEACGSAACRLVAPVPVTSPPSALAARPPATEGVAATASHVLTSRGRLPEHVSFVPLETLHNGDLIPRSSFNA